MGRVQFHAKLALIVVIGMMMSWKFGAFLMEPTEPKLSESELASYAATKNKQRKTHLGEIKVKNQSQKERALLLMDPAMNKKWGLSITDAAKAWQKHEVMGSKDIVVAVIDTGIDVNHPDLKNNLWKNPGETGKDARGRDKATNGIDDDGNGFVDDVHGWNFVANNHDLYDHHGHGTHISGIIGAEQGNGIGISGVSPKVSIMTLKYFDPTVTGTNNLMNTIHAIRYATKMKKMLKIKSFIINYSGGGMEESPLEKKAIAEAQKAGILVVAAAGNESSDSSVNGPQYFPADYDLPNIISVTAIDRGHNVLSSSNYGNSTVDIAAPGNDIYSTLPGGKYGTMTGTSQATAFATGVAVLIMAKFPDFSAHKVIKHITMTGDREEEKLAGKTRFQTRLNTFRALAFQDQDVSFNGAVVKNSPAESARSFASDPSMESEDQGASADSIAHFSKALKEIVEIEANK